MSSKLPLLSSLIVSLAGLLIVSYFIKGIITVPQEGDSLAYHIPIAHSVLNGTFINPLQITEYGDDNILHFYPSIGEIILAALLIVHIPLNLYNVFGVVALLIGTYYLGRVFSLSKWDGVLFAVSIVGLYGILRWINTQVIDIWLAVFYVSSLYILQRRVKVWWEFMILGILLGSLTGIKFTGIFISIFLVSVYFTSLRKTITLKRFIAFIIPFLILGLFWYIRNSILTGNPLYPQEILFFKGAENWNILRWQVWEMIVGYPRMMLDAFISEYGIWAAIMIGFPIGYLYIKRRYSSLSLSKEAKLLFVLAGINGLFYMFLVSTPEYNIMVSSFRYSYPVFIPLLLAIWIIASKLNSTTLLWYATLLNYLSVISVSYHPKLYILIGVVLFVGYTTFKSIRMKYEK